MQENSLFTLSSTRLPFDHFISGALVAGMGAAALGFSDYLNNRATKKDVAKKIAKYAVTGGFVGAVGIHASNLIAQKISKCSSFYSSWYRRSFDSRKTNKIGE